jgi:hypothetical protein
MSSPRFFSMSDGGGVYGMDAGIDPTIMIVAGHILEVCRDFIMTWTRAGETITGIAIGMGTGGIMNGFQLTMFNKTGANGRITDIGISRKTGACAIISPGPISKAPR